jgi:hypothetical protein
VRLGRPLDGSPLTNAGSALEIVRGAHSASFSSTTTSIIISSACSNPKW